jgi:hypothetical protein
MEIQIAVAKINKYAISESGDTLEVVERPNGGLSVVLGRSNVRRGAKATMMVVRKSLACLPKAFGSTPGRRLMHYSRKRSAKYHPLNIHR